MSFRSSGASSRAGRGSKEPEPLDPKQPILDVPPLNSFPYIGPPSSNSNPAFSQVEGMNEEGAHTLGPAVVYLPPHATQEEFDNLVSATKYGVVLTGSAALATIGPVVGRIEISENEDAYRFRVLLPGVSRDESMSSIPAISVMLLFAMIVTNLALGAFLFPVAKEYTFISKHQGGAETYEIRPQSERKKKSSNIS